MVLGNGCIKVHTLYGEARGEFAQTPKLRHVISWYAELLHTCSGEQRRSRQGVDGVRPLGLSRPTPAFCFEHSLNR